MEGDEGEELLGEFLKKSQTHFEEITALIEKEEENRVIIKDGIDNFSESLEELINISGDINDNVNLTIIINSLSSKLFDLIIKHSGNPLLYIEKITAGWKFGIDKYIDDMKNKIVELEKEKKNAS